jgi:hypothetical protein
MSENRVSTFLYPTVCEFAMLSEILPRDRDCAFRPLTAVNIAPRMLISCLARGGLVVALTGSMQTPGQRAIFVNYLK